MGWEWDSVNFECQILLPMALRVRAGCKMSAVEEAGMDLLDRRIAVRARVRVPMSDRPVQVEAQVQAGIFSPGTEGMHKINRIGHQGRCRTINRMRTPRCSLLTLGTPNMANLELNSHSPVTWVAESVLISTDSPGRISGRDPGRMGVEIQVIQGDH
jgi:hypothetical protein